MGISLSAMAGRKGTKSKSYAEELARQESANNIIPAPGRFYVGASDSPDMMIVTAVKGDHVMLISSPWKKERRMETSVFRSLAKTGAERKIAQLSRAVHRESWMDAEIAYLESLLAGGAAKPDDYRKYQRVTVEIKPDGDPGVAWNRLEERLIEEAKGLAAGIFLFGVLTCVIAVIGWLFVI